MATYTAGYVNSDEMFDGPTTSVRDILQSIPDDDERAAKARVFMHSGEKRTVIAKWSTKKSAWKAVPIVKE